MDTFKVVCIRDVIGFEDRFFKEGRAYDIWVEGDDWYATCDTGERYHILNELRDRKVWFNRHFEKR